MRAEVHVTTLTTPEVGLHPLCKRSRMHWHQGPCHCQSRGELSCATTNAPSNSSGILIRGGMGQNVEGDACLHSCGCCSQPKYQCNYLFRTRSFLSLARDGNLQLVQCAGNYQWRQTHALEQESMSHTATLFVMCGQFKNPLVVYALNYGPKPVRSICVVNICCESLQYIVKRSKRRTNLSLNDTELDRGTMALPKPIKTNGGGGYDSESTSHSESSLPVDYDPPGNDKNR
jgi:hypothetical protein